MCRCSQTAGCNSCSIVSGDVSNCSYRLTVHPLTSSRLSWPSNFFIYEKHSKPRGNRAASASVYFNGQRPAICHQRSRSSRLFGTDPSNSDTATAVCVCGVCVHVFARVRAHACVRACVRPFVRACMMCLQYTIIIFDPGC